MGIMEKNMETTIMGYVGFRVYSEPTYYKVWFL